jgi:hypothetical protein
MQLNVTPPLFETGRRTNLPSGGITANINDPTFMQLLITQMRNPDLGSLFGTDDDESKSSLFGNTSELFGSSQNLFSGINQNSSSAGLFGAFGQTPLMSGITPQMELSIWSGLIGKTITARESTTGNSINGKIESVQLDLGAVKLKIGNNLIDPNALESIKIK